MYSYTFDFREIIVIFVDFILVIYCDTLYDQFL